MRRLSILALLLFVGIFAHLQSARAQENVVGEEVLGPGVKLTFVAGPSGFVQPRAENLTAAQSDFHLEVLAGWTEEASADVGAPAGGFVPYLHLFAKIKDEETGRVTKFSLVPHINRADNFHYARNVTLPGPPEDPYTIVFSVHPPEKLEVATHRDWRKAYGTQLFAPTTVTYKHLQLADVVHASR